jgi:hypothetical protein
LLTPRRQCRDVSRIVAAICERFALALSLAYTPQIAREMRCTLSDGSRRRRPSHEQHRAVLGVIKALAALDPTGFGLDDGCAQLESSTYVMADEARPSFPR